MNKVYEVVHIYDVDGGFGDAIGNEDVIAIFDDKEKAYEFANKYDNPHIYGTPYADLWCGKLRVNEKEINTGIPEKEMWWLDREEEDNTEDYGEDVEMESNMEIPNLYETITIMDYARNKKKIELDMNKINRIKVRILSGDELLIVQTKEGNEEIFDSCNDRVVNFWDGEYELDINADWYPKWKQRKSSYKGVDIIWGIED